MAEKIDPKEFFGDGIDFTADVEVSSKAQQPNEFAGIEENLKLPLGSTKAALQEAKKQAKEIVQKTKDLRKDIQVLEGKEKASSMLGLTSITPEVLRSDRERIRNEAFETYEIAKDLLAMLKDQMDNTLTPSDKMWSAVGGMLSSVVGAIEKLQNMNTKFRQEMEIDDEKVLQSQTSDPTATPSEQEMNFAPDQVNEWIAKWSEEQEAKILEEIKDQEAARLGYDNKEEKK